MSRRARITTNQTSRRHQQSSSICISSPYSKALLRFILLFLLLTEEEVTSLSDFYHGNDEDSPLHGNRQQSQRSQPQPQRRLLEGNIRGPAAIDVASDVVKDDHNKRSGYSKPVSLPTQQSPLPQAAITVPMHAHSGTHHVILYIGNPRPQRQVLILDTGSRFLAFPCSTCGRNKCGIHASPYFDLAQSTTVRNSTSCLYGKPTTTSNKQDNSAPVCAFHMNYMEGSGWSAIEMEDVLFLATDDLQESLEEYMPHMAIPFTFGCQTSVTGHFTEQYADGILGMKRDSPFLMTLLRGRTITREAFSTCVTRSGGTFSLGGSGLARQDTPDDDDIPQNQRQSKYPYQYHLEPMSFTRIIGDSGYFSLPLLKVIVGDECMTCDDHPTNRKQNIARQRIFVAFREEKGVLLDSGTTDTYLAKAAQPVFSNIWQAKTGTKLTERRKYTYEQFRSMPDIIFVFEPNTTLVVPASSYMEGLPMVNRERYSKNTSSTMANILQDPEMVQPWMGYRELVLRIYFDDPTGAVLGINAMYGYEILYDLHEHRVGLARAYCGGA